MKNLFAFSFLVFVIIGFVLTPVQQDAFAKKDDNNGKAKGCENANENSKAREKNPHCDSGIEVKITALARLVGFPPLTGGICTITLSPSQEVIESTLDQNGMTSFSVPSDTTSIFVDCLGPAPGSSACHSVGTFQIDPEGINEFTARGSGCL